MRHHRRVKKASTFLVLLVVASLAATGCGGTSTGNPEVDRRNQLDAAYEAVAAAQIEVATDYSNAILKTTKDPEIEKFANSVLAERKQWTEKLDRLRRTGEEVESLAKASYILDISLKDLGITADGTPLAAPSSDAGYLTAMKSNDKASLLAAEVNNGEGGPATSQLSNLVIQGATQELEQIKQLQK
jgi:uncharacterized protein (DUF305 family)